jgi:hypothetical protein
MSSKAVVTQVMSYDMTPIVDRYAEEHDLPSEVAAEHERELKRFLAIKALNPEKRYGMKGPVDELWHTFIIFTEDYTEFCERTYGRYLHHRPALDTPTIARPEDSPYRVFLADYEEAFGEEAPIHLWPRLREVGDADAEAYMCDGDCYMCDDAGKREKKGTDKEGGEDSDDEPPPSEPQREEETAIVAV